MICTEIDEAEALRQLDRLTAALSDLTPAMQDVGEFLLASTEERYDAGVSPDGTPFAPKSPATIERYRRGPDPVDIRPLFKSGTMRRTLHYEADATGVEVGSNAIQAAVMQFGAEKGAFGSTEGGTPLPFGDIPVRPFIGLSDQDGTGIVAIVEEWLEGAVEG